MAYHNAYFGVGSGPIVLDDVQCTSSSNQLLECSSRPILFHNCRHSDDAGVGCEGVSNSTLVTVSGDDSFLICIQHHVQLVSYDWQEATSKTKEEWRSASTICGVQYVMTSGGVLMPL